MRRDDRQYDPSEGEAEIEAIAAQWTKKWEAQGGPSANYKGIERREEFKILDSFVRQLPKGSELLDGGCGLGEWTVYYTRSGYRAVGLDVSELTISKLKERFEDCEFTVADIRKSGFESDRFDLYFSWGTFEHFEEGFGPVMSEAFRILKPGGRLLISIPFDNLRHSVRGALTSAQLNSGDHQRKRFYQWRLTREELAQTLQRSGFQVEVVHIIGKRQGLVRALHHNLGLPHSSKLTHAFAAAMSPFVPGAVIGHMVLAVARKPALLA
ncbi:MAG: class I SAM-dependent methyltransferase [Muricauda sp. TMED12]|nr:MAG: class I SAM-dependent methyltransferase [Muricauda sp. TMED12]